MSGCREGCGRGLIRRISAVAQIANFLVMPFNEAFSKQPTQLLQLLALKGQDALEEAKVLVSNHTMIPASIARILAESFLKVLSYRFTLKSTLPNRVHLVRNAKSQSNNERMRFSLSLGSVGCTPRRVHGFRTERGRPCSPPLEAFRFCTLGKSLSLGARNWSCAHAARHKWPRHAPCL